MNVEILHLGHYEDDTSDKVWGCGQCINPDGVKTGFRFWGAREKKLTFKVCVGDNNEWGLESKWQQKNHEGYEELPGFSIEVLRSHLGEKFADNFETMLALANLVGVSDEPQLTSV
jgi:hypothetical protein